MEVLVNSEKNNAYLIEMFSFTTININTVSIRTDGVNSWKYSEQEVLR
jgi:hypothetical protein